MTLFLLFLTIPHLLVISIRNTNCLAFIIFFTFFFFLISQRLTSPLTNPLSLPYQSKRPDHTHSTDGDGAATKHSPAKTAAANVGSSSEPKSKPKPLLKSDPSTSLEQDSVIEPEIDPEQDPLSPQRMITFDDTTSSKKKKGFFSKGKNIFKKLSR